MKKIAAFMLCAALLLPACSTQAGESANLASGDYEYALNEDGTAVITKYNGSEAVLTVPDTLDGHAVTAIGREAFRDKSELISVTIPEGVRVIGERAFRNCKQLTEIRMPASLETLEGWAFRSCKGLRTIAIPESLSSIGSGAFEYCENLEEFTVSPDNPFYKALEGVLFDTRTSTLICYPCAKSEADYAIPEGTMNVGPYAFNYALILTRLTIPPSMTEIGENAFYNAENLAVIQIPDWIVSIGDYTFYGCRSLREMNIPQGVASIGKYVFGGCESLTDIRVSKENAAYASWGGILMDKAMATILACPGGMVNQSISFPAGVSIIGDGAFAQCRLLTHIEIPSGIASIGRFAFDGCSNLEQISLPDSIMSIGQSAFRYCYQLTNITLPPALKEIDFGMFDRCENLVSVGLPSGLNTIRQSAFENCTSLKELVVPEGVTEIGYAAFKGCAGLTSLWIPDSVSTIEENAFAGCDSLVLQVGDGSYAQQYAAENGIPYALSTGSPQAAAPTEGQPTPVPAMEETPAPAGDYETALNEDGTMVIARYLGNAARLVIPGQLEGLALTGIGAYAFNENSSLEYAAIPEGVLSIGEYAFSSCGSLSEVVLPGTLADIGDWAFSLDEKLAEITIPGSVTRIGQGAFHWCRALQDVMIPPGVTEIGVSAFAGCAMNSVDMPEGVIHVGDYAFSSNASLSHVSIPASAWSIGSGPFSYSPNLTAITVAQGNEVYETTDGVLFDKTLDMLNTYPAGMANAVYAVPEGTQRIGVLAFGSASNLRSVTFPDSVWEIRSHAFFNSGITNLKIPPLVTRIESSLFASCFNLETVSIHPGVEYIGESAFDSCDRLTLEVEEGSFAQQYAAENNIPYSLTEGAVASQATQTAALIPQSTPAIYLDILPEPTNPIIDIVQEQGQDPNAAAFFNVSYYAQKNPDLVAASGGDEGLLRAHWLNYGIHEGRRGSPCFDAKWYLANTPDLAAVFGTDYTQAALHYRAIGVAQGIQGSAEFDPHDYAQLNPDLAAQYGNDLRALAQHYNDQGFAEGRLAFIEVEATEAPQAEAAATAQPDGTPEPEAAADTSEPAPINPWPVVQNTLHKLKTIDKGAQRAMAYRGPGKNYREGNAFVTSKMKSVYGLFTEGKYMLTEMDYAGVGKRRLYFMIGTFTKTGDTPAWDMTGYEANTAADAFPRYGPGEDYNDFEGEVLPAGSEVSVFFEENGWVFMEFMSAQGLDRGWVPAESVVPAGM